MLHIIVTCHCYVGLNNIMPYCNHISVHYSITSYEHYCALHYYIVMLTL